MHKRGLFWGKGDHLGAWIVSSKKIIFIKTHRLEYEKRSGYPGKLLITVKRFVLNNNLYNIWQIITLEPSNIKVQN